MPAVLAHWVVARDVAWRFIKNKNKKASHILFQGVPDDQYEQVSKYLYFGANGPDLPYCRDKSGESKWADLFHYNKQGEFILQLVLVAKHKKPTDAPRQQRIMAYALGHATHLAADAMVHPYVNCFAGAYHCQSIHEIHKTCECHQDSFLAKEYYRRVDVHTGPSWTHVVPPCTQIALPAMPGYTQVNDRTKDVLRDIDEAFRNTHGDSPGFDYLKDCYENYYDVVLDEAYDKSRIIWGVVGSPIPTDPHNSLVQHEKLKGAVKYYDDLLRNKAVSVAEKVCEAVVTLYQSDCSADKQNEFRSKVKNWNMDTGYWIDVKLEGKKLKIIWRHTWC
jgi:hypothetical protein